MDWTKIFRTASKEQPKVVRPSLILSKTDFDYSVGPNNFRNFTYTFDVNLYGTPEDRVQQSREGVEKLVELLDGKYSSEKGFKRGQKGNLSSDSRKIEISYYAPADFLARDLANIHFNAQFEGNAISRSYALIFLYGINQEDLLSTHDSIVGLSGVLQSPSAIRSISQIDQIRKGEGPKVQNFLLS
jgi:hypothetical protein